MIHWRVGTNISTSIYIYFSEHSIFSLLVTVCIMRCVRAKSLQSCPTLCDSMYCNPPGSSVHGDSPGKNTGAGCQVLLPGSFPTLGIFLTQGSNPTLVCLLHWQVGSFNKHNWRLPIKRKSAFRGTAYHLTGFLEHNDPEVSKVD